MSTNFYAHTFEPIPTEKLVQLQQHIQFALAGDHKAYERLQMEAGKLSDLESSLHIGKHSGGWQFGFQAYDREELKIRSFADWRLYLDRPEVTIKDEYKITYTFPEFFALVNDTKGQLTRESYRQTPEGQRLSFSRCHTDDWVDPEGFDFTLAEFF